MKGFCKICGCTWNNPCFNYTYGFCWWPTKEADICSHCYRQEIIDDPNTIHCVNGLEFPVLTVHQPYALMLVKGVKKIEYRNWKLPEEYVGKRIFIHAGRVVDNYNKHYAEEESFYQHCDEACNKELFAMILGSVVFGESRGPFNGIQYGAPYSMYEWPVQDPIILDHPLRSISGKQRIWKIQF